MFTGLIEKTGQLISIKSRGESASVEIAHEPWKEPVEIGESVSIDGACLTVVSKTDGSFTCDVLVETLNRTCLGGKKNGAKLNLERALRAGDRFGGHFVSGHVDGVGTVASVYQSGADWVLRIACDESLLSEMIVKGSIAIDGVSLTITALTGEYFEVNIIPHTWRETSLSELQEGSIVNLETDMIGKYVKRYSEAGASGAVTLDKLAKAGFIS